MTRQKSPLSSRTIRRPLALLTVSALSLGACMPAARVAEPTLTMKVGAAVEPAAQCISSGLAAELRDPHPRVDYYRNQAEITINAPRGGVLAFLTVQPDVYKGSVVKFYNGELYWPNHEVSGVYPDTMRDNWHRVERAIQSCDKKA